MFRLLCWFRIYSSFLSFFLSSIILIVIINALKLIYTFALRHIHVFAYLVVIFTFFIFYFISEWINIRLEFIYHNFVCEEKIQRKWKRLHMWVTNSVNVSCRYCSVVPEKVNLVCAPNVRRWNMLNLKPNCIVGFNRVLSTSQCCGLVQVHYAQIQFYNFSNSIQTRFGSQRWTCPFLDRPTTKSEFKLEICFRLQFVNESAMIVIAIDSLP